jgi:hypothetical protein
MSDLIPIAPTCAGCGAGLTLEEMHWYDHGNGCATCEACELKWGREVQAWLRGDTGNEMPARPVD